MLLACLVLVMLSNAGCNQYEPVRVYKIPAGERVARVDIQSQGPASDSPKKTLAAIIPSPAKDATWFFKLTGEPEVVDSNSLEFRSIVDSLRFDASGKPSWELSEGWTEEPADGFTYAKLQKPQEGVLATVSKLDNGSASDSEAWNDWVEMNVNRWRRQLELPSEDWDVMEESLEPVEALSNDTAKAYFVSLEGSGSGTMGGAPMSSNGPSANSDAVSKTAEADKTENNPIDLPESSKPKLTYELPEGWKELDTQNSFRICTIEIEAKPEPIQLVISEASGEESMIAGMWLQQVAAEATEDAVNSVIEKAIERKINGVDSKIYSVGSEQMILAAAIPWNEKNSMFVKLVGGAAVVQAEKVPVLRILRLPEVGIINQRLNQPSLEEVPDMATANWSDGVHVAGSKASASIPYSILKAIGSLKITVWMFAFALLIVLFGTLAQDEMTLAEVKREYFNCWIARVPLDVLLPITLVPHPEPILGGFGLYVPGGALIGLILLVNLIAAKATRFSVHAKGATLIGGIVVSLIGAVLIAAVIMSGHAANGLQGEPLVEYDTLWAWLKGGLVVITLTLGAFAVVGKQPKLIRIFNGVAALIALALTITLLMGGESVRLDDSGLRIVWQLLQASVASCVALAGLWLVFGKRGGNVLIHAGVGLLMVGQFVFGDRQVEQRMGLAEGKSTNLAVIEDEVEIALIDVSNPDEDVVYAIPESTIRRVSRTGAIVNDENLPCRVRVLQYMKHSQFRSIGEDEKEKNPATIGTGLANVIVPLKPYGAAVVDKVNVAAAYVELLDKDSEKSYGTYLLTQEKNDLSQMFVGLIPDELEPATIGDKPFKLAIRYKQVRKPYDVLLKDVERINYSGTETARDYSSRIVITPREGEGESQEDKTWMNNPIRYQGETFYQSRYNKFPMGQGRVIETTGLQVVRNAGWVIPYVCCMMVFWGMLAHFGGTLFTFANRYGRGAIPTFDAPKISWTSRLAVAGASIGLVGLVAAGFARPESNRRNEVDWASIKKLPVQHEGRIKSFDTVARNILQVTSEPIFATVPSVKVVKEDKDGKEEVTKYKPSEWLLGMMASKEWTADARIFRVYFPELRNFLDLEKRKGYRYSYNEIAPKRPDFAKEIDKLRGKDRDELTPREKKFASLQSKLNLYDLLMYSYQDPDFPQIPGTETPETLQQFRMAFEMAKAREGEFLQLLEEGGPPGIIPPLGEATRENLVDSRWQSNRAAVFDVVANMRFTEEEAKAVTGFTDIVRAVRAEEAPKINKAVSEYEKILAEMPLASGYQSKTASEYWLNKFNPTAQGVLMYLVAVILCFVGLLLKSEHLRRAAFWMVLAVFVVHTIALISRIYISGRAPVINLYSSAVFIGWACVLLCLVMERIYPLAIANLVGASTGAATLCVARFLDTSDTMPVLQAVLDTQFWLSTHVITITWGYAVTFAAGLLGICALVHRMVSGYDSYPPGKRPKTAEDLQNTLYRMTYGVICFAIFFSFVGTVLGGLWADDSWGRFWGWDPKENGAMMIVIWNALILHARWDKQVGPRGFAALAVIGNIMTAWSWFGTNQLGIGLHSYGFTSGALIGLASFIGANLIFVIVALLVTKSMSVGSQRNVT